MDNQQAQIVDLIAQRELVKHAHPELQDRFEDFRRQYARYLDSIKQFQPAPVRLAEAARNTYFRAE
jgi:hypothetical protein